jgi:hypothetical protein
MMNVRFAAPILLVMQLIGCVAPAEPGGKGSPARLILDPLLTRRNPTAGVLSVRRDPASVIFCKSGPSQIGARRGPVGAFSQRNTLAFSFDGQL